MPFVELPFVNDNKTYIVLRYMHLILFRNPNILEDHLSNCNVVLFSSFKTRAAGINRNRFFGLRRKFAPVFCIKAHSLLGVRRIGVAIQTAAMEWEIKRGVRTLDLG